MPNVLGSLFVELRADTAAFVDGMSKASYAAKRAGQDVERAFSRLGGVAGNAFGAFGPLGAAIAGSFQKIGESAGHAVTQVANLSSILSRAGSEGGKTGSTLVKLSEGFGAVAGLAKIAAAAAGAVGVGAIGLAVHTAESAARMLEQSRAAGVSVESLSGLSFAAKQAGVDQETLVKSLQILSAHMVTASIAATGTKTIFQRLGLEIRDHNGQLKEAGQFYVEVLDKLNRMKDRTAAVGAARQVMGRGGAANLAMGDADEIQKWIDMQKALGANLDTPTAEAAHKFVQSIGIIEEAAHGLTLQLEKELLPSLQSLIDYMTKDLALGGDSGIRKFISGIADLTKEMLGLANMAIFTFKVLNAAVNTAGSSFTEPVAKFREYSKQISESGDNPAVRAAKRANAAVNLAFQEITGTGGKFTGKQFEDYVAQAKKDAEDLSKGIFHPPPLLEGKKRPFIGDIDLSASDKGTADAIQKVIDKYEEEMASHLRLADAAKISTAAIKEQQASDLAGQVLTKLKDEVKGRADLVAKLKEQEGAIRAIVSASKIAGDVAAVGAELQKSSDTHARQIESLHELGKAYEEGGSAIAAAKIESQLELEKQKLAEVSAEIEKLDPKTKDYSATLANLRVDLFAYNAILDQHRQSLAEVQRQTAQNQVQEQSTLWAAQIPLLDALNASYFRNAEAVREAQVALEIYDQTQKLQTEGADTGTIAKAAKLFQDKKDQERRALIDQQSEQYNLNYLYDSELEKLTEIKAALEAEGKSSLTVDTAIYDLKIKHQVDYQKAVYDSQNAQLAGAVEIYDEGRREITQWDDRIAKVGDFSSRIRAMINEVELQGSTFGEKIFSSFTKAIDDVSTQLAEFVVTGKSNFRQLFESLEKEILKATFQRGIAAIFGKVFGGPQTQSSGGPGGTPPFAGQTGIGGGILGAIGSIFGIKTGLGKPDGSKANPFYMISAGGAGGGGLSSLLGGGDQSGGEGDGGGGGGGGGEGDSGGGGGLSGMLHGMISKIGSVFSSIFSHIASVLSTIGKGFMSVISGIGGLFGGFREGGGDVSPGKAYIVGERHPEVFFPKQAGRIMPSMSFQGNQSAHTTVINFHVHGVQDFDSFRRSQGQIHANLQHQAALAYSRNK
jgi:hypothetical protein